MRHLITAVSLLSAAAITAPTTFAAEWYEQMQLGPAWNYTFGATINGKKDEIAALKGVLVDMGDNNRALFDTETLRVVTAYKGNVHWAGTPWTGAHGSLIKLQNEQSLFTTVGGPGWADSAGKLDDKRPMPGYGNLPYAKYRGYFREGKKIIFAYEVLGAPVYESFEMNGDTFVRQFQIAPHKDALTFVVADDTGPFEVKNGINARGKSGLSVAVANKAGGPTLGASQNRLLAKINASGSPVTFTVTYTKNGDAKPAEPVDLASHTKGGEGLWKQEITLSGEVSADKKSPWVTDTLKLPTDNPWKANLRFSGFDFIDEDTAAICTWTGDVWTVKGLKGDWSKLVWKRFASGLFEPLGLKVVKGVIYVHGRDQITKLIDSNGDGEADRYESFFREYIVSKNFHEFDFELQTDKAGNFYTAKASPVRPGGRGFDQIFPHHGTLMKISADGSKYQILATGLRAPGGLAVGPNGEITTGENEGTWQPCCKINYFIPGKNPVFLGTEDSRHDVKDPMLEPLCYLPMSVDNSGASQVWVPPGVKWGLKPNELIHLSYGQSSLFRVLPDPAADGTLQGGVVKLPIKLQSSAMRARFNTDGSLYVCGLRGWQTNAAQETAFQRIRFNQGAEVIQPDKVEMTAKGVRIHFEMPVDQELAKDVKSYSAERYNYVRGPMYGGGEYSVDHPDKAAEKLALEKEEQNHHAADKIVIKEARVSGDRQTIELDLEGHKPSQQLVVNWQLEDGKGQPVEGSYWGTYRKPVK